MNGLRLGASIVGIATALCIGACSSGDGTGTSDEELRKDSFDRPTAHGELRFADAPNEAAFTEDQRFHSWTFTLTGDARLDLQTKVSHNLDTVAYLYRRDAGSNAAWGEHIGTNDDTGGTIASRIKKKLGAGEYLLKVKAGKVQLRGAFSVLAACSGAGCPAPAEACAARSFATMPDATGFGASCQGKIDAVLSSAIASRSDTTTTLSTKCALQPVERLAVDFYHAYWDDVVGWSDFTGTDEGEDEALAPIEVTRETHGAGTVVDVDAGGDESAMTFVFDASGALLFYYQHNQSPAWDWFCKDAAEASSPEPDESCISDSIATEADDGTRRFACQQP